MKRTIAFLAQTCLAIILFSTPAGANTMVFVENDLPLTDSLSINPTEFTMKIDQENQRIEVTVTGNFDKYATLSVTDNRGSELEFSFIKEGKEVYYFDLHELDNGSYFLVLNMDTEIRIKRFSI